jgi:hypothetical protein
MRCVAKRILIIVEGLSEYRYAEALKRSLPKDKQRAISVELPKPSNENGALQLLSRAEKMIKKAKRENNPYDSVWIFFDHDNQPNLDLFFQKLNKSAVKIAYSSICFEHWFILHFEDNRQPYANASLAIERLNKLWKNHFNQNYHKTRINHFEVLRNQRSLAISRANAIKLQAEKNETPMVDRNPFFTIQELIQYFNNI